MIGPTTPLAERPDWHPVHRANALLHAALLSSNHAEPSEDRHSVESLSPAIANVMKGPVSITYPTSLAARLDALAAEEDSFPAFELLMDGTSRRDDPCVADGDEEMRREADIEAAGAWDDGIEDPGFDQAPPLAAGMPLDPDRQVVPPQVHVQTLMREFHRRQRHASLLVAGSIATAAALTLGGLVLVASLAAPPPDDSEQRPSLHSTSIVWQRPAVSNPQARLEVAAVGTNRAAKSEPLPVPAYAAAQPKTAGPARSAPQTILAASGRDIAFGPLLPPSHARYLLIRGLPPASKLSAGRDSGSGSWLVKGEYLHDLTLTLDETAAGDYPIEVYELESGDGPQGRRNFVLRVEPPAQAYAEGTDTDWASALLDVVPSAHAAEQPAVPAEPPVLRSRARQLLDVGDIAGARLLLLHLAEHGDGQAAYELARTFDRESLAELGARGLDGDSARARGWYERASQDGNAKATERLKILASLSGTGPSD
jgi:hypothetical protein